MNRFIAAASAIALLAGATAAHADDEFRVSLRGIDLKSEVGAAAALERIENAAERYCRPMTTGTRIVDQDKLAACKKEVTEAAVAQLQAPRVSSLYASRQTNAPAG